MKLFVIPTHRNCEAAITSILKEINYAICKNEKVCLAVVENSKKNIFLKNKEFLKELARTNDFPIYHIGLENMRKIIKLISQHSKIDEKKLFKLIYPQGINYGKIANYIYILATILKASSIHRRDSDCFTDGLKFSQYPIVQENKYINQKVIDIKDIDRTENLVYSGNDKICIVGGGYHGNWNIDMEEINKLNPNAMKILMNISGVNKHDICAQFQNKYIENTLFNDKQPLLNTVFSDSFEPECGNISVAEVYKYIPNFIGENGIGFDYHTYFMSIIVKVPIIFHYNKIFHIHDVRRNNDINILRYWRGIIKMVDFDCVHKKFLEKGFDKKLCEKEFGLNVLSANFTEKIPNFFEDVLSSISLEERLLKIDQIINEILKQTKKTKYIKTGDYLNSNKLTIIDELNEEYSLSLELQRLWHVIMQASIDISQKQVIKRL